MHIGLWELLDALWPIVNTTFAWGVSVHPYDAGDPRANLTSQGIYTFATLRESVAEYQCRKLAEVAHVPIDDCWQWPQTQMWASEQGWPLSKAMNKTMQVHGSAMPLPAKSLPTSFTIDLFSPRFRCSMLQARNICFAHGLSVAQGVWAVSHNFLQSATPTSQGDAGDFSLLDEPPVVFLNLTNAAGHDTYDAYRATAPGVFGVTSDHYCCRVWRSGCVPSPAVSTESAFYVSPTGDDSKNTGLSPSSPWRTLPRAQQAIVGLKQANGGKLPGDVIVNLAAGVYYLGDTFTVTAADSGDVLYSVSYVGPAPGDLKTGGVAVLSGGVPITGWAATSTPDVFMATVPARKGAQFMRQLFGAADGQRRPLARSAIMKAQAVGQSGVVFSPGDVAPSEAAALTEAEVVIWHNWVSSQSKIKSINWETHNITCVGTAGDPYFDAGGLRWALQNVADPEKLAPGTFYVVNSSVVYRLREGEAPLTDLSLVGELLPQPIVIAGTSDAPVINVRLANLTVAHAAAALEESCLLTSGCGGQSCSESATAAIRAHYAQHVLLDGLELLGSGAYAVWFDEGCVDSTLTRSWLHSLGMGGVRVGNGADTGSPSSAPARGVTIADCVIEDAGHIVPAGTGVLAQECANTTITHNHIHHLYYTAISTGWTVRVAIVRLVLRVSLSACSVYSYLRYSATLFA